MAATFMSGANQFLDGAITEMLQRPSPRTLRGPPLAAIDCPYAVGSQFRKVGRHVLDRQYFSHVLDDYSLRLRWVADLPFRKLAEDTALSEKLHEISHVKTSEAVGIVGAAWLRLQGSITKYVERHFTEAPGIAHITVGGISYSVCVRQEKKTSCSRSIPVGIVNYTWKNNDSETHRGEIIRAIFEGHCYTFKLEFERVGIYTTA